MSFHMDIHIPTFYNITTYARLNKLKLYGLNSNSPTLDIETFYFIIGAAKVKDKR